MIQKEFTAADAGKAAALTGTINQAVSAWAPAVLRAIHDFDSASAPTAVIQLAAALIAAAHDYRIDTGAALVRQRDAE